MNLSVAPNSDLVTPTPSRILLVDDEPSIRRFVANLLTGFGHEASTAGGVDEALLLLAGGDYHVALIDLAMPGRTGLDLLSELQAREHPVVPILLTGSDDIAAVVSCMKIGAFVYVAKPCERGALFRAVERAVVVATARRHKRELEFVVSEWVATFDACPDQLLVLDSDGRVLEVDEAAARAAGMDREGAAGRRVEEL